MHPHGDPVSESSAETYASLCPQHLVHVPWGGRAVFYRASVSAVGTCSPGETCQVLEPHTVCIVCTKVLASRKVCARWMDETCFIWTLYLYHIADFFAKNAHFFP